MATKKSWWIAQNIKDSPWQRLWVKRYAWESVNPWNIIIRQRVTKYYPWDWVLMWRDHTIFAVEVWTVHCTEKRQTKFYWRVYRDTFVHVQSKWENEVKSKKSVKSVAKKPSTKKTSVAKKATKEASAKE